MPRTSIVLDSKQVQLVEPTFDGDPMETADSVRCTVIASDGATLASTLMTYDATLPVTNTWGWLANVNMPSSPMTVKVRVEAIKAGATKRWVESVTVKKF